MNNDFFHGPLMELMTDSIYSEQRKKLLDLGASFLTIEESNKINFPKLFDSLRFRNDEFDSYLALPKREFINLALPYEVYEHKERKVDGVSFAALIEKYVNDTFEETKFIFSANPDDFLALKFTNYSFGLLSVLFCTHPNTPIVLFDGSLKKVILFHFDLRITILSRHPNLAAEKVNNKEDQYWIDFFNENFVSAVSQGNQYHLDLINANYVPRLTGGKCFSF